MRIVKYTSILSTLLLIIIIAFTSKSFAFMPSLAGADLVNVQVDQVLNFEPIVYGEEIDEHFTPEDQEYLNDFEVFHAANDFFDLSTNVVLAGAKVSIKVYRSKQKMAIYVGGRKKFDWKTTTGSRARYGRGATTPKGTFTPYGMTAKHRSRKGYTLPYSIKMYKGYFIHGTKANHMLGKKLSRSVGSHGCMRLSMSNARTLFNLVKRYGLKNTRITVL